MHSIDSIETYAYVTSKDLVNEKKETNCNNVIKRWLTLIILRKKI